MDSLEIYRLMARYNRWANEKLGAVCATLSDAERKADRHAPFRSIHGLWNHLLLADRVWLSRFNGTSFSVTGLDQELYADFEELRRERALTDTAIETLIASLTEETLASPLRFAMLSSPEPRAYPYYVILQHMFNHHAHHRGQMTALLDQMDVEFGVTDLLAMPGLQL